VLISIGISMICDVYLPVPCNFMPFVIQRDTSSGVLVDHESTAFPERSSGSMLCERSECIMQGTTCFDKYADILSSHVYEPLPSS
jgi:hypothetical protein